MVFPVPTLITTNDVYMERDKSLFPMVVAQRPDWSTDRGEPTYRVMSVFSVGETGWLVLRTTTVEEEVRGFQHLWKYAERLERLRKGAQPRLRKTMALCRFTMEEGIGGRFVIPTAIKMSDLAVPNGVGTSQRSLKNSYRVKCEIVADYEFLYASAARRRRS